MKSLYEIIGTEETADANQVKDAYREKAKLLHPDKTGGDDSGFKKLAIAYGILSDPDKRKQYDETGECEQKSDTEQARATVIKYFLEVVGIADRKHDDIIQLVRDMIEAQKANVESAISRIEVDIVALEEIISRIESDNDLFRSVIETKLKTQKQNIELNRVILNRVPLMYAILDEYKYRTDKRPEQPGITTFTIRGTGGGEW
ncbi:MAG: DnaJ domain-containing protein [Candidatus Peribacteraceae bacterium]|nr:DnaJ domain-containing protein [Candidatus Peribacteraceae bacterium]